MDYRHISVMPDEVIEGLDIKPDGVYVDCTLGGAGHTRLILQRLSEKGRVIGIDRDEAAIENAKKTVCDERLITVRDNFENIAFAVSNAGYEKVDGILMDLGVSSYQLDNPERGFSYMKEAPLDMRMDSSASKTASDVVNGYPEKELARIIRDYGEEKFAFRIASRIAEKRAVKPIETTAELSEMIESAIPAKMRREGGHPAKRTFQAIRIEVNGELDSIPKAISDGAELLKPGGRMAVISFHSLEDRIVKNEFQRLERPCTCPPDLPVCVCGKKQVVKILTKKPVLPKEEENESNSRAHSAKLRICERI
ncbi:MAG: 16S rRNA (cytosine(1402)-N(4))-methyltransferase RsmH [Clostridia bacterium]|nr:16S rRNA (cytosine(1402)-N(4))-methyltransferase RsmH [Clostridia bacterium]